jgi:hypothetical protein
MDSTSFWFISSRSHDPNINLYLGLCPNVNSRLAKLPLTPFVPSFSSFVVVIRSTKWKFIFSNTDVDVAHMNPASTAAPSNNVLIAACSISNTSVWNAPVRLDSSNADSSKNQRLPLTVSDSSKN